MIENWKPVVGYEGLYEVSDHGRVRSLDRPIARIDGSHGLRRGRVLKQAVDRRGRHKVLLSLSGQKSKQLVPRLVLAAFEGPCPPGHQCCHYDDDPGNNHLSNLRWDTPSSNSLDAVRNGRHSNARKTHCPQGHEYTEENTYRPPSRPDFRTCRTCLRDHQRRAYQARRQTRQATP